MQTTSSLNTAPLLNLENFPRSKAFDALEELKREALAKPESINLDALPPAIRNVILKALGESGQDIGLISAEIFAQERKGALRNTKEEEERKRKKREFFARFLAQMEAYMRLFQSVAIKVALAEERVNVAIKILDQQIKGLQKEVKGENTDTQFNIAADRDSDLQVAEKHKEKLVSFRKEIKKHKKVLEAPEKLPDESKLKEIDAKIDTGIQTTLNEVPIFSQVYNPPAPITVSSDDGTDGTEGDDGNSEKEQKNRMKIVAQPSPIPLDPNEEVA